MPRTLRAAAIQMDSAPAPTADRLSRAGDLIAEAAAAGARLIALPELFNTGYEYHDRNYELAEPLDGATVTWIKAQAAQYDIHLAGTLMLLDGDEVYNTALLVAPDGRTWRYNKLFPFIWERTYFREGHGITVADTDLGDIGMMICWDSAHAGLWARYAGRVDAMLILSNPPKLTNCDFVFPDGERVNFRDLGPFGRVAYTEEEYFPGVDMDSQAGWLGVPVIATAGAGQFRSRLPLATFSLAGYVATKPTLWKHIKDAPHTVIEAAYDKQTKIIDARGNVLARVLDDGDGFTLAEVELPERRPQPAKNQPKMRTASVGYFVADYVGVNMMTRKYRQGVRRQWGARMAPVDPHTRIWTVAVGLAVVLGWILGRLVG